MGLIRSNFIGAMFILDQLLQRLLVVLLLVELTEFAFVFTN